MCVCACVCVCANIIKWLLRKCQTGICYDDQCVIKRCMEFNLNGMCLIKLCSILYHYTIHIIDHWFTYLRDHDTIHVYNRSLVYLLERP